MRNSSRHALLSQANHDQSPNTCKKTRTPTTADDSEDSKVKETDTHRITRKTTLLHSSSTACVYKIAAQEYLFDAGYETYKKLSEIAKELLTMDRLCITVYYQFSYYTKKKRPSFDHIMSLEG